MRLTDEGRALHERTHGPLSEIAEAQEVVKLGASAPQGRLRVSAPVVLAHVALGRVSARFAQAYPEVKLELIAEDRRVDPVEDGYDLVIRVDPSEDERLVGRRILDDQRWIVAPTGLRFPSRAKGAAASVVKAVLLTSTPSNTVWRFKTPKGIERALRPEAILRLSSLLMVREAVLAGAGAALLPRLLIEEDVSAGRLTHWGTDASPPVQIWVLRHSRRLVGAKVRAFLDLLEKSFPNRHFARLP
jgi:DNA-binding transcriptional LysR family regulator